MKEIIWRVSFLSHSLSSQSGNNLEFKAMTTVENLFAKYNVSD